MHSPFAPELSLVIACCRPGEAPGRNVEVELVAGKVTDWGCFSSIVGRNRVTLLVHDALNRSAFDPPATVQQELVRRANEAARRSLLMARESLRLQQAFDARGLPAMIVKGTPLAILAYGDLSLKESLDIDLLVLPEHAAEARRLLIDLGYLISLEGVNASQFERLVQVTTEAGFYHPTQALKVDLHWRLADNRGLLGGIDAAGPAQLVRIPGGTLRTLADEALFSYLCLHGALHAWNRLKWLADLAAFVARRDQERLAHLYACALEYDVGRSARAALLLCRRLFGLPLDGTLQKSLEEDRIARALAANVTAGLAYRGGTSEHGVYTLPWLRTMAAQFVIEPGASQFVDQLRRIWTSPRDRTRIPLPRWAGFLYHVIRIPLWLARIAGRALGRIS